VTLFDLVFLLALLSSVVAIVRAGVALARGRGMQARRIGRRLAIAVAAYVGVVIAVALASPQRFSALGETQCSDDWCITADSVRRDTTGTTVTYTVGFALSSRARRVAQRERFVVAYLRDGDGRRIDAQADAPAIPFDTLLQPGQTIRASRRFVVSRVARDVGLVIAREGGFRFPGCCIIGDESSLLHKRTIVRLD
jgi:hypothetical protein